MYLWGKIADSSYQTAHELEIIEGTAHKVVHPMPAPVQIVDLGAANSEKFAPYIKACIAQGKEFKYVPLDLDKPSLAKQVERYRHLFPQYKPNVHALWGSFEDGDRHFKENKNNEVDGSILFLSLGSIFYNAPDSMCDDRCREFRAHLRPEDRLIVGQDSPAESGSITHSYYQTDLYRAFMTQYLQQLQEYAGIVDKPTAVWEWTSMMEHSMHYFELVAKKELTCTKYDNYVVNKGRTYRLFKSWKRGAKEIYEITKKNGLAIKTLGKAKNSGMTQYLISLPKN